MEGLKFLLCNGWGLKETSTHCKVYEARLCQTSWHTVCSCPYKYFYAFRQISIQRKCPETSSLFSIADSTRRYITRKWSFSTRYWDLFSSRHSLLSILWFAFRIDQECPFFPTFLWDFNHTLAPVHLQHRDALADGDGLQSYSPAPGSKTCKRKLQIWPSRPEVPCCSHSWCTHVLFEAPESRSKRRFAGKWPKQNLLFLLQLPLQFCAPGRRCKACSVPLCEMVWPQSCLTLALLKSSFQQCPKDVEFTVKLRNVCFVYLNCFYFELFLSEISRKINTKWEPTLATDSSISWKPEDSTQPKLTTH